MPAAIKQAPCLLGAGSIAAQSDGSVSVKRADRRDLVRELRARLHTPRMRPVREVLFSREKKRSLGYTAASDGEDKERADVIVRGLRGHRMNRGVESSGVREGDIIAGKYRVEDVLGVGGMGVVFGAYHVGLEKKVAIKVLLPEMLVAPGAVARFLRESKAAVRIESEHVARVLDVGTLPNGAPYMVMEFLEGGDLTGWLHQRGPLPVEQAVDFVLQACVGAAEAHGVGIVHRDLKPANLFCVRRSDGQLIIKVLDFGISKMADLTAGSAMSVTKTGSAMGSPLYMSPEQMRSAKDVDVQTDIWAMGVILFELLAGRPPFVSESLPELALQVVTEPAPPLRSFRPDAPAGIENVIFRCLEKDRRARYRNLAELGFALLPFAPARAKALVDRIAGIIQSAGLSASAPDLPPSPTPIGGSPLTPGTAAAVGRTVGLPVRRRIAVLGTVGVFGAGLVVGVMAWTARPVAVSPVAAAPGSAVETTGSAWAAVSLTPALRAAPSDAPTVDAALPPAVIPAAPPAEGRLKSRPQESALPASRSPSRAAHVAGPAPAVAISAPTPAAAPPAAPLPVVPQAKPPNCTPPYFIDSAGDRQYKPECL